MIIKRLAEASPSPWTTRMNVQNGLLFRRREDTLARQAPALSSKGGEGAGAVFLGLRGRTLRHFHYETACLTTSLIRFAWKKASAQGQAHSGNHL